ncbi:hypothetical protein [Ureibacillus aquaedulcis]|uniref:Uncharacterized protein n=1 Tax=Ureibacillus aquaedulcis TaxID=3058421 RepID=A0ABT8GPY1_9BACL|nr:hypothetical protein [Ureibacillus sp. BA0131]MDN4493366.1 hypothetical protein [Ureibacillus sp. BA0131]
MIQKQESNYSTPTSIQILFNNQKLEIMKVLCLLNALSSQNNKQRKVEEILFYYSIVNFELDYLFREKQKSEKDIFPSSNQYFRFQTKINEILLLMSSLKFIEVKGKISNKLDDLKVKLLKDGRVFFVDNSSDYLKALYENYIIAFNSINYSMENVKIIKEGY